MPQVRFSNLSRLTLGVLITSATLACGQGGGGAAGGTGGGGATGGAGGGGQATGRTGTAQTTTGAGVSPLTAGTQSEITQGAGRTTTTTGSTAVNQSNFLRSTFATPEAYGAPGATGYSQNNTVATRFGQAIFGTTNTTGGGARGGAGGAGGVGGGSTGNITVNSSFSPIRPARPRVAYSATVRNPVPITTPQEAQIAAQQTIANAAPTYLPSSQVEIVMEGRTAILRGTVADSHAARVAEGMVRLTPGVRDVKNELKVLNEDKDE